jgi:hypothetical protein
MRRLALAAGVAGLVLTISGCTAAREEVIGFNPDAMPACLPQSNEFNSTVVLMAQAVPSASLLPCVRGLPVGWELSGVNISDGLAQFWFDSTAEGQRAVVVELMRSCEMGPVTRIPSTMPEVQRYEQTTRVTDGYGGKRYFTYAGGCTTYTFDLHGESRAQPLAALTQAFDFIDRDEVAQQVDEWSDGRIELDPESR